MSEQENVRVVQELYAGFGRGDIPTVLALLAEDAEVLHAGPPAILPWAKPYRGRDGWAQFFQDLGQTVEFEAFEPREFVAQGDKVVALGWFRLRGRATGRPAESPWAMEWTVREGKVASCRVHEDTAALVEAVRPD